MPLNDHLSVSVIISCYNLERYIGPAIRSVLDQSRSATQIIAVDDASTDGSAEIIASFGSLVTHVRLANNGGVLNATLAGIAVATGDIVAFLDGDDLWRPEKLERVAAEFAADSRLVLLSHDYAIIDGNGVSTGETDDTMRNTRRLMDQRLSPDEMSDAFKDSILSYRGVWLGSAFTIRRAAIDVAELERFIASVSIPCFRRLSYQDHLLAQFVIITHPDDLVGFLDVKLFDYRIFPGNTSGLSASREAALRTLARGHVNVLGTRLLLEGFPRYHTHVRRQARMARTFAYMTALYTGRTLQAIAMGIGLALTYWHPRQTIKEVMRTGTVALLGSDRFFAIKTRRRFKDAPPPPA